MRLFENEDFLMQKESNQSAELIRAHVLPTYVQGWQNVSRQNFMPPYVIVPVFLSLVVSAG